MKILSRNATGGQTLIDPHLVGAVLMDNASLTAYTGPATSLQTVDGRCYQKVSKGSNTADGLVYVTHADSAYLWRYVPKTWLSASDFSTIEAALSAAALLGRTLYVAGSWTPAGPLTLDLSKVQIVGDNAVLTWTSSTLTGTQAAITVTNTASGSPYRQSILRAMSGVELVGPSGAGTTDCLYLNRSTEPGVSHLLFERLSIHYFGRGVVFHNNTYLVKFRDCDFWGNGEHYEILTGSNCGERNSFSNCNFYNGGGCTIDNADADLYETDCSHDFETYNVWVKRGQYFGEQNHYEAAGYTTRPFRVDNADGNRLSVESSKIICSGILADNPKPDYFFYSATDPVLGKSLRIKNCFLNGCQTSSGRLANSAAVSIKDIGTYRYGTQPLITSDGDNLLMDGGFEDATILDDWIVEGTSFTDRYTDTNCKIDLVSGSGNFRSGSKGMRVLKEYGAGSTSIVRCYVPITPGTRVAAEIYYKKPGTLTSTGANVYFSFYWGFGYRTDANGYPSCVKKTNMATINVTFPDTPVGWTPVRTGEDNIQAPAGCTHLVFELNLFNCYQPSGITIDKTVLLDDFLVTCI